MVQRGHGFLGEVVLRDGGVSQNDSSGLHGRPTDPRGDDGLCRVFSSSHDRFGDACWFRHRLRCENDQQSIDVRINQREVDGRSKSLDRRIAQNVDRVSVRPAGRQDIIERRDRVAGQLRQRTAQRQPGIAGHDTRTTGIRHDGQAISRRTALSHEQPRAVEEFLDRVHSFHARMAEGDIVDRIDAGDRSRM